MAVSDMAGYISNIQRFSVHDGPGIRTTVFLKGCGMRCFWCHNPETLSTKQELQLFADSCKHCAACVEACANNVHLMEDSMHIFKRELCSACGDCVKACFFDALKLAGKLMKADEVLAEILRDKSFYQKHGGGVTFSGGEPFYQAAFLKEILKLCRGENISTIVESALHVPYDVIEQMLPLIDIFLVDIKHLDSGVHKKATGVDNKLILSNLQRLVESGADVHIRIPIIPGFNDNIGCVTDIASFIKEIGISKAELIPFHGMAIGKYQSLGLSYDAGGLKPPEDAVMNMLKVAFENAMTQLIPK